MSKHQMEMLKDTLCKELDEIAEKGELSAGDLEAAHKLTDTIKNIQKIDMLEYAEGYSGDDDMSMARGRSYHGSSYGNSYGDYSGYRGQGRDGRGRYSRDDGGNSGNYSGRRYVHGYYRDGMRDKLEELMEEAGTEKERRAIQKCMDSMNN